MGITALDDTKIASNIQFADLRNTIESKYMKLHSELSECYYNKKSFRGMGILDKETFDKLHGLLFLELEIEFDNEYDKLPAEEKQGIYNKLPEDIVNITNTINNIKNEGLDIKRLLI
jgi:hypothetical protein